MSDNIFKKHELPNVWNMLDALQSRADALIYSKESPMYTSDAKEHSNKHVEKVFGVPNLSNGAVDQILKEVQLNYVALAKDILIVEC